MPETMRFTPKDIDDYIAHYPKDIQSILKKLRQTIHAAAPQATETISYQMPAFAQHGILVYFAAFKDHVSFFPTSSGIAKFEKEMAAYKHFKGTVQFPLDRPIPYGLISRITKFRVKENLAKAEAKKKKK